jgi:hypothetical protein
MSAPKKAAAEKPASATKPAEVDAKRKLKKVTTNELVIEPLKMGHTTICLLGTTPFICNRVSRKAMQELLYPSAKKNAADKAATLKHDPLAEFKASPYILPDESEVTGAGHPKTLIGFPTLGIKASMRSAALDIPGTKKAQIGRLVFVDANLTEIYGIPEIFTAIAKNKSGAGPGTPDPRTRAIIPQWAAFFKVSYALPLLNETSIFNLLMAAGQRIGIGDWRQEKGAGSYGCFEPVNALNGEFVRIVKTGGRKAQEAALADPRAYDQETADLLDWFNHEVRRRGLHAA